MYAAEDQHLSKQDRSLMLDSLRQLLAERWPIDRVLQTGDRAFLPDLWHGVVGMGLLGGVESGVELTITDIAAISQELGKSSCSLNYFHNAIALPRLNQSSVDDSISTMVQSGVGNIWVAVEDEHIRIENDTIDISQNTVILSGEINYCEASQPITHLLVKLSGAGMALVDLRDNGVTAESQSGFDKLPMQQFQLNRVSAQLITMASTEIDRLRHELQLCYAARGLGCAQRAFSLAHEYSGLRRQFGREIGRFQAIAHKLVNCFIAIESSQLLLQRAIEYHADDHEDAEFYRLSANAFLATELRHQSLEFHHVFGAIGFSEEHELPRHFRQIHVDMLRLGRAAQARQVLAKLLQSSRYNGRLPDFNLGEKAEAFRHEIRRWLKQSWDEEAQAKHRRLGFDSRGYDLDFSAQMGARGWIGRGWPADFGGDGCSAAEQYVLVEEMDYAGAPVYAHLDASELIGPALIEYGSEQQQKMFLPEFRQGKKEFCLGYSEPGSGSDLASIRTRAERCQGGWLINGQKIWTTRGAESEYIWLAAKTDVDASPPHSGISVFIVSMASPGITVQPSMALYGHSYCSVFLDDVYVQDEALVGEANGGWKVITHALTAERLLMGGAVARVRRVFELAVQRLSSSDNQWCEDTGLSERIGELAAKVMVARLLAVRSVEGGAEPQPQTLHQAAMSKVYSSELMESLCESLLGIFGMSATLSEDAAGAITAGEIEQTLRRSIMMVIGGGTAEIQRNTIARKALGLRVS